MKGTYKTSGGSFHRNHVNQRKQTETRKQKDNDDPKPFQDDETIKTQGKTKPAKDFLLR
jgi:hypothetical protein